MPDPRITLEFDEHAGYYLPGDRISGRYVVEADEPRDVNAIEASVLWYTLGKGEEDLAVHYFDRHSRIEGRTFSVSMPRLFGTILPNSPLSYDGQIVKICWCVRVRVIMRQGREAVSEQPFRLGATPRPGQAWSAPSSE